MCGLDDLIKLCELGWCVFPVVPNGKNPITKHGYKEATNDLKQVERWINQHPGCNWGMVIPPEAIVIDIDILDDGSPNPWPGQDQAADLLCAGAITSTPNDGNHYYFRQQTPGRWDTENGWIPKSDTRTNSEGYVLLPGSRARRKLTNELKPYEWVEGYELNCKPEELPLPPDWLVEALDNAFPAGSTRQSGQRSNRTEPPPECKIVANKGIITFVNTNPDFWEEALKLVERSGGVYLKTLADGTQHWQRPGKMGDGLSATWNNPGTRDINLGFPRFKVFTANWPGLPGGSGENDPKAYSTWDLIQQLETPEDFDLFQGYARLEYNNHLGLIAAEKAAEEMSNWTDEEWTEYQFGDVWEYAEWINSPEDKKTEETPKKGLDLRELVVPAGVLYKSKAKPIEPLIPGVIGAGEMATLVSGAKAGKTYLGLDLAIAANQGREWFTGKFHREMRVVYIDGELPHGRLTERLQKVVNLRGYSELSPDDCSFTLLPLRNVRDVVTVETLASQIDWLKELQPDLIIGDNLRSLFPHSKDWSKATEQDNVAMKKVLCLWSTLMNACPGSGLLLFHHTTKNAKEMYEKPVIEHGAGGGAFGAFPDGALSVYQVPPEDDQGRIRTNTNPTNWKWVLGSQLRNYPSFTIKLLKIPNQPLFNLDPDQSDYSGDSNREQFNSNTTRERDIPSGPEGDSPTTKVPLTYDLLRSILATQKRLLAWEEIINLLPSSKHSRRKFLKEALSDGVIVEHDTPPGKAKVDKRLHYLN